MTRTELQAIIDSLRQEYPNIAIELRPGLETNGGYMTPRYSISCEVRLVDYVHLHPEGNDAATRDYLRECFSRMVALSTSRIRTVYTRESRDFPAEPPPLVQPTREPMTRAELRTLIANIREEHPEVRIRLHRQLTRSGEFRVDLAVPLEQQIDIPPESPDTERALREEVEIMIEQASPETREEVRDDFGPSEAAEQPATSRAPILRPKTLWEHISS